MHSHQKAHRKFRNSHFIFPWFSLHAVSPWSTHAYEAFQGQHTAWQESPYISFPFESSRQPLHDRRRTRAFTREDEALCTEEEQGSRSDDRVECDLSNMEVT